MRRSFPRAVRHVQFWQIMFPHTHLRQKRGLRALQFVRVSVITAEALLESIGSNYAARKTSHKCCAAALCTNRSDIRKDLTFHAFPKDPQRRMEWALSMRRSDSKFNLNRTLLCLVPENILFLQTTSAV